MRYLEKTVSFVWEVPEEEGVGAPKSNQFMTLIKKAYVEILGNIECKLWLESS